MTKRHLATAALLLGALLPTTGCYALVAPYGAGQADVQTVYPHAQVGTKRGEASATCTLGLFYAGDAGIEAARQAGGLKRITHVDRRIETGMFTYTITTIVYGD